MKTKLFLFFSLLMGVISGVYALEVKLTPKDFELGTKEVNGVATTITHKNGVYTVNVKKTPKISNQTRGTAIKYKKDFFVGKGVWFRAEMRCENIGSDGSGDHIGGKIIARYTSNGATNFFTTNPPFRLTQTWREVAVFCPFAAKMDHSSVVIGIQQGWGTLQFRNPRYEVVNAEDPTFKVAKNFKCSYSDSLLDCKTYRGVMSPPWYKLTEQDIIDLQKWNVNLVRYQIVDGIKDYSNIKEYEAWIERSLKHLEKLLPTFEKCGIKVVIDMHRTPGANYGANPNRKTKGAENARLFNNPQRFLIMEESEYRECFIRTWQKIAKRFYENPNIYGYDLCNEPQQKGVATYSYYQLQFDAVQAIREIDNITPIIVEGNYSASPAHFNMQPMPFNNIIYSIHMYIPDTYTHQATGTYPKRIHDYRDEGWSKAKLRQAMANVRKFQKQYNAKIYVGEFSAAIWALGAAQWLDDVMSIFEEYNFDYTYHAFREWEGWSLEHEGTPDNIQKSENNDRKTVVLKYFKKNQK